MTSATPSIRRRRWSICATVRWLVAQPASWKVGTLPEGVAEETLDAAVALVPVAGAVVVSTGAAAVAVAIEPSSELIEVCAVSTRPNSWKACAQSKRVSTSEATAWARCSRNAAKVV